MSELMQSTNPNGPGSRLIRDKNTGEEPTSKDQKPWKERLAEATQTLLKYKGNRASLEQRVIEAERYYRLHNWWSKQTTNKKYGVKSNSGWLFASCNNKHADAMDNIPEANVLPREMADENTAKLLSEVLPCVLELNDYEEIYDTGWWDKLIKGTAVYAATWDAEENNGLGEISIKRVDVLSCFWDTNCSDIQDSKNFFFVTLMDIDELRDQYGDEVADNIAAVPNVMPGIYAYETVHDTTGRVAVIDWYYKKHGILQYAKYVEDELLYASEDDERYRDTGYYNHQLYPFIFDPLYPQEGAPVGMSHVDLCRDAQDYIDRMDSIILDSALINGRPKYFYNNQGGVSDDDVLDPEKPLVRVNGVGAINESIMPFGKSELNPLYVQVLNSKISELRETSGSTEASQGGAPAGVTAYSALAALQEASGKTSRQLIRAGYRRFKDLCYMVIELMRQFYDTPRIYRITGDSQPQYVEFDNSMMQGQTMIGPTGEEFKLHEPVYDIKVKPSKQTSYSRMAQNELAKELYGAGIFAPQNADSALAVLDMMEFEGKDKVVQKVQQNGTMMQMMQQMAMQIQQLQGMLGMQQPGAAPQQQAPASEPPKEEPKTDSLGNEQQSGKRINAPKERAAAATAV
jgi:hypothetical protein